MVRPGEAIRGEARIYVAKYRTARLGLVRRCGARLGTARLGTARFGKARLIFSDLSGSFIRECIESTVLVVGSDADDHRPLS